MAQYCGNFHNIYNKTNNMTNFVDIRNKKNMRYGKA